MAKAKAAPKILFDLFFSKEKSSRYGEEGKGFRNSISFPYNFPS